MNNLNVIDQFMQTFIRYIDSGFGLLQGDVAALTTVLIGIDITLAGLFWAMEGEANVLARLIKKVLYVGSFALIINNFSTLSMIIFNSFSTLGLQATNSGLTAADLLRPGKLAGTGFQAAWPLLQQAGALIGFTTFFNNFVTIVVLLFAWIVVVLSFFILAVQLFITILEFKLTTLAGFVLVPFALWGKTAFLAERVLGNVVSSGIKVMVLAVIVGIGATFFSQFTSALQGQQPSLADAMSLALASLSLFGLGIFGPAIATGLVSGAPQLGAGAALGTVGALVGGAALAGAGAAGAGRLAAGAGLGAVRAGTALTAGASAAYQLGQATSGASGAAGVGAGLAGVARAGAGAVGNVAKGMGERIASGFNDSVQAGRDAAFRATGGTKTGKAANENKAGNAPPPASSGGTPDWARRLRNEQRLRAHAHTTSQAIKEGDRPGAAAIPDLDERER
ncbi:MAG: P-type conjugative transfer protein TrbL [Alphaproteobacteria bacterium]|nr:P-type conjugative transfer protein TrbL [Alphaproteobacteria bacterium]